MDRKKIFDAHTHFNDNYKYNDNIIETLVDEALQNNVGGFLCASFDTISSRRAIALSKEYKQIIYAGIAIHPNDVENYDLSVFDELEVLIKNEEVVCVGETGLDYFYTEKNKEKQIIFFEKHIELAKNYNKTLQIHIRDQNGKFDAYNDVLKILDKHRVEKVVIHCFSANEEYALKFLSIGCFLNIGGAITFKNSKTLQKAIMVIPWNKLLVETDAPYLTPHPYRGQVNHPKYINLTVEKIAELKCVPKQFVVEQTTLNAIEVFGLKSE